MTTTADEDGAGAAAATTARATGRVVKRGLPTLGLVEAENAASKLWDVARRGMTAQTAFAKELGLNKASGGAWAAHLAHLRGFGVVLVKGDEIGLSPIGLDLAEDFDDAKRLAARRKAVMTLKSYRELVQDYDQTTLPAMDKIASKLEHEYGKNADFAKQAAAAFIASLKHAQMLDSNNVVRKAGADTMDDGAGQASTETMPPEPSTTDDNPPKMTRPKIRLTRRLTTRSTRPRTRSSRSRPSSIRGLAVAPPQWRCL
jgi:hypothetical protein